MKPSMLLRLYSLITSRPIIMLRSRMGEVHFSVAWPDPWSGGLVAYVYWFNEIGRVELLDDGAVSRNCEASYIKEWRYYDLARRTH